MTCDKLQTGLPLDFFPQWLCSGGVPTMAQICEGYS